MAVTVGMIAVCWTGSLIDRPGPVTFTRSRSPLRFRRRRPPRLARSSRTRTGSSGSYAELLELPGYTVIRDAAHGRARRLKPDFYFGVVSGVRGTPTPFTNGRRYAGRVDLSSLRTGVSSLAA
jgi:hypothetical protein